MCPSPRVVTRAQCPPGCRAWARPSAAAAWGAWAAAQGLACPQNLSAVSGSPDDPVVCSILNGADTPSETKVVPGLCKHRGMDPLPASGSVRNVTTCSQGSFTVTETSLVWSEGSPDLSDNPSVLLDQLCMKWGSVLI